jgi:hypothetical protein
MSCVPGTTRQQSRDMLLLQRWAMSPPHQRWQSQDDIEARKAGEDIGPRSYGMAQPGPLLMKYLGGRDERANNIL